MPIRMQFKFSEKNMLLSGGIGRCRANTQIQEEAHISLLRCLLWTWKVCGWHVAPPLGSEVEWSGGRCVPAIIKYFLACWALSKAGNRHLVENQTDVVPMFMNSPSACPWYVCVCVCVWAHTSTHACLGDGEAVLGQESMAFKWNLSQQWSNFLISPPNWPSWNTILLVLKEFPSGRQ